MKHILFGRWGERKAARFLKRKGYKILKRNCKDYGNEIDIICTDYRVLRFVEVKTRKNADFANPREAVTYQRRQDYRKTAQRFAKRNDLLEMPLHFDIIEVVGKKVIYLPDDF